jgi:hypothetical protein
LNVGYAGDYYESQLYWETAPEAKAVTARIGPGPGFANGEFATLTAQDAETGAPIADAEVRVTTRQYHFLPLPDRVLRTGADGKVRVPLGPARPPSRLLTVAVTAAGYFGAPETWQEGALPEEALIGMERARKLEGIVKIGGGPPLDGAQMTISA